MRTAALLTLVLAGCIDEREVIILMDERFEEPLDAWTITGYAEVAPTIHPGEHALFFYEPVQMDRTISVSLYGEYQDGNWIEYTSNCGDPPTVTVERRADLSWRIVLQLPRIWGEEIEPERIFVNVPPVQSDPYVTEYYSQFSVVTTWGGCWIDNLRLMQPQPDDGW